MNRSRVKNHGIALLLVLTVIGLASLIGMAMLSSASLQAQVADSANRSAVADYLADSAVQTAAYYLQRNQANMPTSWGTHAGYAIYKTNVQATGVDGTFDVTAAPTGVPDEFVIHAVGRSSGTNPVTRTTNATLRVIRAKPTYAAGFGGSTTVVGAKNFFVNGAAVAASGTITNTASANFGGGIRIGMGASEFSVPSATAG
jgi:Tfp pilus assembly protein PilX